MKEKGRIFKILIYFLVTVMFMTLPVSQAQAQATHTVCATGCDFTSIQDAIAAAAAGDTIEVSAGTYTENLTVNKSIELIGEGRDLTTVQGVSPTSDSGMLNVAASDVTIDGFEFLGVGNKTVRITQVVENVSFLNNRVVGAENTGSDTGWSLFESNYNMDQTNLVISDNIFVADNSATLLYLNPNLINLTLTGNTFEGTMMPNGLVTGFDGLDGTQDISGNTFDIESTYALLEAFGTYDIVEIFDANNWPEGYIATGNMVAPTSVVYPSTNEINRANDWAHVNKVSGDLNAGTITLDFIQPRNFYSCFEYRTDGDTSQKISEENHNPEILDGLYPFECLDTISTQTETFDVDEYIEVRLSFGAEKDERFYWTRFELVDELWVCESGDCGHPGYEFDSVQDAIDAADIGATIYVYPGEYEEQALDREQYGTSDFMLFVDKELSLIGVDADGNPIEDYSDAAAEIKPAEGITPVPWGPTSVFVNADNVSIQGLNIYSLPKADGSYNKNIEITGDNFSLTHSIVQGPEESGSLYFASSNVQSFTVRESEILGSFSINDGAGDTLDETERIITNNELFRYLVQGETPEAGWLNNESGAVTLENNTFTGSGAVIYSVGNVLEQPWESYFKDNTFLEGSTVALSDPAAWTIREQGVYPFKVIRTGIQGSIDVAEPGDTVLVGPGTYVEEFTIDKPLHIIGQGEDTVVQSPDEIEQLFGASSHPIILIEETEDVTIENLVVDGAGKGNANHKFIGVAFSNAGGTLSDLTITGIIDTPFSGVQHGVAVSAYNTDGISREISLLGNTFVDFQKNAIALNANETTPLVVDIQGNTITGAGATDVTAQNGIQVWAAQAEGTIADNSISGIGYDGSGWVGSSILLYDTVFGDLRVDNNIIEDAQMGVYLYDGSAVISNNQIEIEKIGDFSYGIIASDPPNALPQPYGGDDMTISDQTADARAVLPVEILDNEITLTGETITDTWGILAEGGWTLYDLDLTINGNIISGFDYGVEIFQTDESTGEIINVDATQNCIVESTSYGMLSNAEAIQVNAINNFWGHSSGPYHPTLNADGEGGAVSDDINFEPWWSYCEITGFEYHYYLPLIVAP